MLELVNLLFCIGHIQKIMSSRLSRIKKDMKSKKLEDGKPNGGRNHLTDAEIDNLQLYYGLATRSDSNNLETMKKYEQLIIISYLAVSYTHLDVYKRQ